LYTIVSALRRANRLGAVLWSGQHTTLTHGEQAAYPFTGALDLGLPALGHPVDYADMLTQELTDHLDRLPQGPVLVQGDTATAYAGAMAAASVDLPLIHIEAGIRTHDHTQPWPEELFRTGIDDIAAGGTCSTPENQQNLIAEGHDPALFPVTYNPGLDRSAQLVQPTPHRQQHVLVTIHRRESFGEPLALLVEALVKWSEAHPHHPVLWPTHPNPEVQKALPTNSPITLLPPLQHRFFLQLLASARAVLTDSGGVQEEAAFYGVPALIARTKTDRPESVASGHAKLTTPLTLSDDLATATTYGLKSTPSHTFGDGNATPAILDFLTTRYP
jgi:UDP-N-acetylglucosamine 2-epimerase (non-hydrolysing)